MKVLKKLGCGPTSSFAVAKPPSPLEELRLLVILFFSPVILLVTSRLMLQVSPVVKNVLNMETELEPGIGCQKCIGAIGSEMFGDATTNACRQTIGKRNIKKIARALREINVELSVLTPPKSIVAGENTFEKPGRWVSTVKSAEALAAIARVRG